MSDEKATDFLAELRWRGLLHNISEGAEEILRKETITAYIGFDPTADSLHIGSLLPVMLLVHLQRHGHTPIALMGGGTGMIGDPSGKTKERLLLSVEDLDRNMAGIRVQMSRFLRFEGVPNPAKLLNNADWLRPLNLIDFMRDVGKHFSIGYMLAKDSVKMRLESEDSISFTEFSYMLLQSYDFLTLYRNEGCTFQMGGSDQWGNITAGAELIRRIDGGRAFAVTNPLVTTASGVKFGKTESGAVWLDPARTSPFRFYQYWLNISDEDVITYLKYFTLLGPNAIAALEEAMRTEPHRRAAQQRLAEEVTRMTHGEQALAAAQRATGVLFGGKLDGLSADELMDIFADVPSSVISRDALSGDGLPYVDLAAQAGLERSKEQLRSLIQSGGMYLNNERVTDPRASVTLKDVIGGQALVLRKGKKQYHLLRVE